ncbi:SDR family oxidoreductase [Phenylobacterium sp. LjRoot219]|uniref:SDR family oxidoreductase n=1 Tax=Phenylobacterium sp. LjRoot219 TaxID=3342283 RepID=UPI003ECEE898
MRVLIVGAYGLVGGYVTARLSGEGHEVIAVGRDVSAAKRRFPLAQWARVDLGRTSAAEWRQLLDGVSAVVNCAGALQDSPRDNLQAVHVDGLATLVAACSAAGVRRFVQISAAGVERGQGRFGQTKTQADEALRASDLEWVILRPGLVLAPAAYGGSALLRGLAAFPGAIPALHADARVQTVAVDDVAEAVSRALQIPAEGRAIVDLVAAEETTLADVLHGLRGWLGLPARPVVRLPGWLGITAAKAADVLALFGWRSPLRSAALGQLAAGVIGRADDAERILQFRPRSLAQTLAAAPSGVQERWFARLYFLKPLALAGLAAFWAISGLVGLAEQPQAAALLTSAGFSPWVAQIFVLAGSLVDLSLAALILFRRTAPLALRAMIAVTLAYLGAATIWLPGLWADPLGPLVKSVPAAILALAALAMMDER